MTLDAIGVRETVASNLTTKGNAFSDHSSFKKINAKENATFFKENKLT